MEKSGKFSTIGKTGAYHAKPLCVDTLCTFVYGLLIGATGKASFPRDLGVGGASQHFAHVDPDGQT